MSSELKFLHIKPRSEQRQYSIINAAEVDTPELVEILQQSAVEHLTIYRQLEVQQFCSVVMIITADFEALYAYKHGDITAMFTIQNVRTLVWWLHAQFADVSGVCSVA